VLFATASASPWFSEATSNVFLIDGGGPYRARIPRCKRYRSPVRAPVTDEGRLWVLQGDATTGPPAL